MNNKLTVTTRFSPELIEQTLDLGTDDLVASKARQVIQLQDQGIRDALASLGWTPPDQANELRQRLDQALADVARLRETELEKVAPEYEEIIFGKDCPIGKVQVEHVGVAGAKSHSKYGWNPGSSAFIEIYVDGLRYRIDVGSKDKGKGLVRGLHVCGPMDMQVDKHSVNACSISAGERTAQRLRGEVDDAAAN